MGQFNKNTLVVTGSRVGVGKSNPTVALDVSGSVAITGSMAVSGDATFASSVQVANAIISSTSGHAYITGPTTAGKFLTLQSGNTTGGINFRDSNSNSVGQYYQVTDAWSFDKPTSFTGVVSATNATVSFKAIHLGSVTEFSTLNYDGISTAVVDRYDTIPAAKSYFTYIGASAITTLTSTGLAVTGTLSATGAISTTNHIQLGTAYNLTWGGPYGAGIPTIAVPSAGKLGFYPNGSTSGLIGEFSSTGLALTGTVSSTGAATFAGQLTISSSAPYLLLTATTGTNYAYTEYVNTGNNFRVGLENSSGASIVPGAPAYSAFVASVGARSLVFATNNVVRQTIDSAGDATFAGNIAVNGTSASTMNGYLAAAKGFAATSTAGNPVITANEVLLDYSGGGRIVTVGPSASVYNSFTIRQVDSGNANPVTAFQIDASSNATFAGAVTAMIAGTRTGINDDSVASFTPLVIGGVSRGCFVIFNTDYNQSIIGGYFSSAPYYYLYTIVKSADVTITNTTTMTGTTGTDGKMNIGFNNGIIYIENRLGGSGNFLYLPFGGTN
jgi:hypothetical protein